MTTPPPTARPSASTITDDQLDQLHAELAEARAEAEQLHADIRAAAETIRHLEAGLTHAEAARDRHSRDAQLWVDAATGAERVRQMAERDRDEARAALEQERHVSSARGRYLAEVDAALIAAGQDEGGGYIAYARRISQLAADLDALRRQAADADAVTAQTKRLMAVRTETLRRRAERAEAEQNRLAITRGQVWWQLRVSEDAVQRARDLHQPVDAGSGPSCEVCSNHGDINWPCATVRALDGPAPGADRPADDTDPYAFVPPAADGLPTAALDSASRGASALDAYTLTHYGRNLLAHALTGLARDGWLRPDTGQGWEPSTAVDGPAGDQPQEQR